MPSYPYFLLSSGLGLVAGEACTGLSDAVGDGLAGRMDARLGPQAIVGRRWLRRVTGGGRCSGQGEGHGNDGGAVRVRVRAIPTLT